MKTNRIYPFLIVVLISFNAVGQLQDYKISDYKLPDIKRHAIDTDAKFSGYNTSDRDYDSDEERYLTDKESNYNGKLNGRYSYLKNTRRLQQTMWASFINSSSFTNIDEENYHASNSSRNTFNSRFTMINRFYLKERLFVEVNPYLYYLNSLEKSKSESKIRESNSDNKYLQHNINTRAQLKAGVGRIEQVQDARQALLILQELQKKGRLNESLSNEDITQFAELISALKNQRFFDSRLQRIRELNAVDSFLISNMYIIESGTPYRSELVDLWDFGSLQVRPNGTRFSVSIDQGYAFSRIHSVQNNNGVDFDNEKNESLHKNNDAFIFCGLHLTHEKAISLQWQHSIYSVINYSYQKSKDVYEHNIQDELRMQYSTLNCNFKQAIAYYPNTRTEISIGYNLAYNESFYDKSDDTVMDLWLARYISFRGDLVVSYYVSPQLRINLTNNLSYLWRNSDAKYPENEYNFDMSSYSPFYPVENENNKSIKLLNEISIGLSYAIF